MASIREVAGGKRVQGVDEEIIYTIDVSNAGDSPSNPSFVVKDESNDNTDVTSTVAPVGSASVDGNVITLPTIKLLTAGHVYRCEFKFTVGGNVLEHYFRISAEE